MSQFVAYLKHIAYGFIKIYAKSHSFNILCTMDVLSRIPISELDVR